MTIAASDTTLAPLERLKTIYPRYADAAPIVGADGLSVQGFRDGSPYQGEDLICEPASPERFLLRCTRQIAATPACACTSGASAAPTSRCAFRAHG